MCVYIYIALYILDYAECRYAECRYAECRYAKCRGAITNHWSQCFETFFHHQ